VPLGQCRSGSLGRGSPELGLALPLTPRSPSPRLSNAASPACSPKRQRNEEAAWAQTTSLASSIRSSDDLESRAAALGLNEVTQQVWRETELPPTPTSPSPTFSRHEDDGCTAAEPAPASPSLHALAASLGALHRPGCSAAQNRPGSSSGYGGGRCDSDSGDAGPSGTFDAEMAEASTSNSPLFAWTPAPRECVLYDLGGRIVGPEQSRKRTAQRRE
jgi:hypothetical protein